MKKLFLSLAALASLALLCAAAVPAQSESNQLGAYKGHFKPGKIKKELNLNDDQVAKIKTEFAAHKDPMKAQAQKVHAARSNLRDAIQSNAAEPEIRTAAAAVGAAEGDLAMERSALFASIKPILTPEQLEKFHALQSTHSRH
jgi:Spy/CpxP family protein refolding chaperone